MFEAVITVKTEADKPLSVRLNLEFRLKTGWVNLHLNLSTVSSFPNLISNQPFQFRLLNIEN